MRFPTLKDVYESSKNIRDHLERIDPATIEDPLLRSAHNMGQQKAQMLIDQIQSLVGHILDLHEDYADVVNVPHGFVHLPIDDENPRHMEPEKTPFDPEKHRRMHEECQKSKGDFRAWMFQVMQEIERNHR